ncbi:MAG: sugar transferase [Chloroflexota bacterium]|nr:MAG: sugar transferase [Chloroflexota bacterium]
MIYSTKVQTQLNSSSRSSAVQRRTRFPLQISQRKILLISVDLFLLNLSLLLGLYISEELPFSIMTVAMQPLWFVTLSLIWMIIASANDNYEVKQAAKVSSSVLGIFKTLITIGLLYAFIQLLTPQLRAGWTTFLIVGMLSSSSIILWRIAYALILVQPNFQRRALIVGSGKASKTIYQVIEDHDVGYEIVGFVTEDNSDHELEIKGNTVIGEWSNLTAFVHEHEISDLILAVSREMHPDQLQAVLKCFEQGVRVVPMPEVFEEITGRIPVDYINERWLLSLPIDWDSRRLYLLVKRAMDIILAGSGLLGLALFFPFMALIIKLDSPGPIFYRPRRLGRGGKSFRLWKFRTMVSNADKIGNPTFTAMNDNRITRIGRILRTAHIDELPQLINVVAGDMSLVGPRPERLVPELEESIPYYRTRYAVKPGATGWALVNQGYAEGVEDTLVKLQYDLYYIKHLSLSLDILIIFKSVIHMLTMRGR